MGYKPESGIEYTSRVVKLRFFELGVAGSIMTHYKVRSFSNTAQPATCGRVTYSESTTPSQGGTDRYTKTDLAGKKALFLCSGRIAVSPGGLTPYDDTP